MGAHVLVVVAFALPAVALWWHAWDGHLSSTLTCACGDAGQTVWFLAWPAYALSHGLDPFFSSAVQAPYGVNLLTNASAVPIGVLLAPVTLTAGPIVATNVALTLCPALSAWACWVACRRLVTWRPAGAIAGLLFGYSPFVVTNLALGHLGLALLVAPPLLVVATRQLLFGPASSRRRCGAGVGALLGAQFLISSEIFAIVVVIGVPCTLAAAVVGRRLLAPRPQLLRALGLAGIVVAAVLAFPMWFFLAGPQHLHGPLWQGAPLQGNALTALWDPGHYRAPAGTLLRFGGYEGRAGPPSSYLGPVVLGVGGGALAVAWRRRTAWLLALGAVVAAVCSFGAVLWLVPGRVVDMWMPWKVFGALPLLGDIIPQRFSAVTDLCIALLIGVGVDAAWRLGAERGHAAKRRSLALFIVLAVSVATVASAWWTYQVPFATRRLAPPSWYAVVAPRLPAGTVVLSYPFPFSLDGSSGSMVWQALDGMRFRLAGGYVKEPGPGGRPLSDRPVPQPYVLLARLTARAAGPMPAIDGRDVAQLRNSLTRWRVGEVVVVDRGAHPASTVGLLSRVLQRPPRSVMGAWVWKVPASP